MILSREAQCVACRRLIRGAAKWAAYILRRRFVCWILVASKRCYKKSFKKKRRSNLRLFCCQIQGTKKETVDMDAQSQQQQTIEGTRVQHVRFYKDELQELMRICEENGEVTVAVRIFPSDEYKWQYPPTLVSVARARLEASGRATEIDTVMDSNTSRLVLVTSAPTKCAIGEVQVSLTNSPSKR
jgi:hypothetical protein